MKKVINSFTLLDEETTKQLLVGYGHFYCIAFMPAKQLPHETSFKIKFGPNVKTFLSHYFLKNLFLLFRFPLLKDLY